MILARLRQLLGLQPGDCLELTLETDGLRLRPHASVTQASAQDLIGCAGYQGPVWFLWSSWILPSIGPWRLMPPRW